MEVLVPTIQRLVGCERKRCKQVLSTERYISTTKMGKTITFHENHQILKGIHGYHDN